MQFRHPGEPGPGPGPAPAAATSLPAVTGAPATKKKAPAVDHGPVKADAWAWTPQPPGPPRVLVTVEYDDGWVSGLTDDRQVHAGASVFKLSNLRRWRRSPKEEVQPAEGPAVAVRIIGLDDVTLRVGDRDRRLDLTGASAVTFEAPRELARVPGLEELCQGRFIRPFVSRVPVTSFRLSRPGRSAPGADGHGVGFSVSGGGSYVDGANGGQVHARDKTRRINIGVNSDIPNMQNLVFLDIDRGDGLPETGKVRVNTFAKGKYVVWELEPTQDIALGDPMKLHSFDHPYVRLAIDFCFDNGCAGMIRYNAMYR